MPFSHGKGMHYVSSLCSMLREHPYPLLQISRDRSRILKRRFRSLRELFWSDRPQRKKAADR